LPKQNISASKFDKNFVLGCFKTSGFGKERLNFRLELQFTPRRR